MLASDKDVFTPIREMEQRNLKLQVGDTIKCHDKDDAVTYMTELAKENIETDFMYEKDGVKGLWLVVKKVGGK